MIVFDACADLPCTSTMRLYVLRRHGTYIASIKWYVHVRVNL
jgi:hypothetical protein